MEAFADSFETQIPLIKLKAIFADIRSIKAISEPMIFSSSLLIELSTSICVTLAFNKPVPASISEIDAAERYHFLYGLISLKRYENADFKFETLFLGIKIPTFPTVHECFIGSSSIFNKIA
jgi:hypothetical protein